MESLLGGADRSFAVEEIDLGGSPAGDDESVAPDASASAGATVAAVVQAVQSPPFMSERRIVVVRSYEQIGAGVAGPLVEYLRDPLDTSRLVLVAGGGRVAKALADALKGAVVVGADSERTIDVLAQAAADAGLTLRNDASALVAEHLGEDVGRVGSLVDVLASAYGSGVTLGVELVEPYLGESGSVPAFQLTNRIEEGDVAGALETVHRLLTVTSPRQPKASHPLQVLGLLHARYRRLLLLDDPAIRTDAEAHAALGGKGSTYPAVRARAASRRLGTAGLRRAVDLLHRADLDLKGASGAPEDAVMEVLVTRLAGLSRRR